MRFLPALLFLSAHTAGFGQQISLSLSSGSTTPGGTVSLSIDLSLNGEIQPARHIRRLRPPASLEWTLNYSPLDFASVQVSATPATAVAGKSISCTASPGSTSCLLIGLNVNPISSGALAIATFQVSPTTSNQTSAIELTNVVAASPQATGIPASGTGSAVTILQAEAPVIYPTGVFNAASLQSRPLAPGEMISLFGSGLGPPTATASRVTEAGRLDNFVSGTRVLFDGSAAPLLFVQSNQVRAIVPYETIGQKITHLQVEYQGTRSQPVLFPVADTAVAIFTVDSSGQGQGLVFNEDGSLNSPSNPAKPGSVIAMYATGCGQTDPPGETGQIAGNVAPKPLLPVTVFMGGMGAEVLYAGVAPGSSTSVLQVNTRIPDTVESGVIPISLMVGPDASQSGVMLATGYPR